MSEIYMRFGKGAILITILGKAELWVDCDQTVPLLWELRTLPEHRGKGYGRELLSVLTSYLDIVGLSCNLDATGIEDEDGSTPTTWQQLEDLYREFGFKFATRTKAGWAKMFRTANPLGFARIGAD